MILHRPLGLHQTTALPSARSFGRVLCPWEIARPSRSRPFSARAANCAGQRGHKIGAQRQRPSLGLTIPETLVATADHLFNSRQGAGGACGGKSGSPWLCLVLRPTSPPTRHSTPDLKPDR